MIKVTDVKLDDAGDLDLKYRVAAFGLSRVKYIPPE